MRRRSALVLGLGLLISGAPAQAQYADENISYFTGAWTCGVERVVFRPADFQALKVEFSLGDTVSATASFGIPTLRYLAPPIFDPDARGDEPQPSPAPAQRRPYYYEGFLGDGVTARLASYGPDSAGVWTWTRASATYLPTDAVMTWTIRSKAEFDRSFGTRQANGTITMTKSDTCLRDSGEGQRVRQTPGRIDFSHVHFPQVELPAARGYNCRGTDITSGLNPFVAHVLTPVQQAGRASFDISPGFAPPGVVATIAFFVYEGDPPQYFLGNVAGGEFNGIRVAIPNVSSGRHPFWIGTSYLYPNGELRIVRVLTFCVDVPKP